MLVALSIRDIVLIDKLDLSLAPGLCALTGETGAGKSILLDSLGLAIGARADAGLVRQGAEKGSVTAVFDVAPDHPARVVAHENDLEIDGDLILRRVQTRDGRSRAFINDQPVGVALLKRIGEQLVEIHGQHAERGLLDARGHRALLDAYGGLLPRLEKVRKAWQGLGEARDALETHRARVEKAKADQDYLTHVVAELEKLAPEEGEEARLADERALMMQSEKVAGDLNEAEEALSGDMSFEARLNTALRRMARAADQMGGALTPVIEALERTLNEAAEARGLLADVMRQLEFDPARLEKTEERLFALRAAARKHNVPVDELPALRERLSADLADIEGGEAKLAQLAKQADEAEAAYRQVADALSEERAEAAGRLDKAVAQELAPLKLDKAIFTTSVDRRSLDEAGSEGVDRVEFLVATNPGASLAPMIKIASGGELARFVLALKVSLAGESSQSTLIFDEVDSGVGGAVAEAVGIRLSELAKATQVLVVTHSPQVAARASHHYLIAKQAEDSEMFSTRVGVLDKDARREEIARMLAGAVVTDEARAAADRLIGAS